MPRYFFDLVDDKRIYDKKGVSLPNEKEAQQYAMTFARELMDSKPELMGESWRAWSVQVCNGKFDPILTIPFAKLAEPQSAPQPLDGADGRGPAHNQSRAGGGDADRREDGTPS
jgi:hypothetical protein